jgi:hypothetical protein
MLPLQKRLKNFSSAEREFIEKVTGTNLKWTNLEIMDELQGAVEPPMYLKNVFNQTQLPFACSKLQVVK